MKEISPEIALKDICGVCGNLSDHTEESCEASLKNCGACGEYYLPAFADSKGFHSAEFCEVRADEELEAKPTFKQYVKDIKPLTIADLKKAIANLPDDVQVLLAPTPKESYADWFNVSQEIGIPDLTRDDSDYIALTFFPVDTYDSRQF